MELPKEQLRGALRSLVALVREELIINEGEVSEGERFTEIVIGEQTIKIELYRNAITYTPVIAGFTPLQADAIDRAAARFLYRRERPWGVVDAGALDSSVRLGSDIEDKHIKWEETLDEKIIEDERSTQGYDRSSPRLKEETNEFVGIKIGGEAASILDKYSESYGGLTLQKDHVYIPINIMPHCAGGDGLTDGQVIPAIAPVLDFYEPFYTHDGIGIQFRATSIFWKLVDRVDGMGVEPLMINRFVKKRKTPNLKPLAIERVVAESIVTGTRSITKQGIDYRIDKTVQFYTP